jgi:hypothetical protein
VRLDPSHRDAARKAGEMASLRRQAVSKARSSLIAFEIM